METYDTTVGELAHLAIAQIAAIGRAEGQGDLGPRAWSIAGELVRGRPQLGYRSRAARLSVASAAAVYAGYFLPPAGWHLIGSEIEIPGGRLDLGWRSEDDLIIYDEIKLAASQGSKRGDGPTSRQVARYAAYGVAEHGAQFAGVRLILLGTPRRSMLVGPGDRLVRLTDTALWFEGNGEVRP